MSKLLSVIVPVYNVETYLPKCIDSILNQTYDNIELLLVDDGSTDGCADICDSYVTPPSPHRCIKVIHKENGGQGSARNRALDIAQGEYIAFVDSDDYIEPDMYAVMIDALERTNSDMSLCGFVTHSSLRLAKSVIPKEETVFENAESILRAYLTTSIIGSAVWNKVYKKHLFAEIRFPEGVAREDVYILHHVFDKCRRAVHTAQHFYNYIVRDGSSEHQTFHPKFLVSIQIADNRRDMIQEKYPNLLPIGNKSSYGSRISAIKKIVRSHAVKEYRQIYDELRAYLRANPAPTKEYKKLRRLILYFPALYRLKLDFQHKYRAKLKKIVLKVLGK